jgi:hypothetical protein
VCTACGHSFCRQCLKRALDLKNECPTCRAPCSLLGINFVLSALIESRFPDEYERRTRESKLEELSENDGPCGETGNVYPVIEVDPELYKSFIPGLLIDLNLRTAQLESARNAFRFLEQSGSSKISLYSSSRNDERFFFALCEVLRRSGSVCQLKVISRCKPTQELEVNVQGGYLVGLFQHVNDLPIQENDRLWMVERLRNIVDDLHNQFLLIGMSGRDRVMQRVESICPGLLGSHERTLLTSVDSSHRNMVLDSYTSFEKISFLASLIVLDDSATRDFIVSCTDTTRRLEIVQANLRSPGFLLSVDGAPRLESHNFMRTNSFLSAAALFVLVFIVLILKGLGIFGQPPRGANFRI